MTPDECGPHVPMFEFVLVKQMDLFYVYCGCAVCGEDLSLTYHEKLNMLHKWIQTGVKPELVPMEEKYFGQAMEYVTDYLKPKEEQQ